MIVCWFLFSVDEASRSVSLILFPRRQSRLVGSMYPTQMSFLVLTFFCNVLIWDSFFAIYVLIWIVCTLEPMTRLQTSCMYFKHLSNCQSKQLNNNAAAHLHHWYLCHHSEKRLGRWMNWRVVTFAKAELVIVGLDAVAPTKVPPNCSCLIITQPFCQKRNWIQETQTPP